MQRVVRRRISEAVGDLDVDSLFFLPGALKPTGRGKHQVNYNRLMVQTRTVHHEHLFNRAYLRLYAQANRRTCRSAIRLLLNVGGYWRSLYSMSWVE